MRVRLGGAKPSHPVQIEQDGHFVAHRVDHVQGTKPVFNVAAGLRDSFGK